MRLRLINSIKMTFGLKLSTISFILFSVGAWGQNFPIVVPEILDATALKDGSDGTPALNPCDDFYHFACGRWLQNIEIPADKERVSHQATALLDQTDEKLNQILLKYGQGDYSLKSGAAIQLGDYYHSCTQMGHTSKEALAILKKRISQIQKLHNTKDLAKLVAQLHLEGVDAFFGFRSGQDLNDATRVIGFVEQGGMGLPEPEYYSKTDAKSVEIRQKYKNHIYNIFRLLGVKKRLASQYSNQVLEFETQLASHAFSIDDRNDPSKINHPISLSDLKKSVPLFRWDSYFKKLGVTESALNLNEPEFYKNLNHLLSQTPFSQLKVYLIWHFTSRVSTSVDPIFEKESFNFWNVVLRGEKKMKPLWKRCTISTERHMGYALAEAYVSTIDTVAIRSKIESMILSIKKAFTKDLNDLTTGQHAWMDQETMHAALEKLNLLNQKIGAPDKWRDYSNLKTVRGPFIANDLLTSEFESRRSLAKIGKPVDHSEWDMMPWEINAYYDPPNNEFVFPFGILQPPSFDLSATDGANLGAFGGGTIGHELTHGYDNFGRQYDGKGNLKEWWTPDTKKRFDEQAQCFIEQANAYQIEEVGMYVNGKITLPENLADQGGVKLGYAALEEVQSKRPPAGLWLGKYSENQQYWIAYAQSWCMKRTPEALRTQITTNEHPPEEFRVNGVVMNRPEFARDFACKENDRMAPAKRCSIW